MNLFLTLGTSGAARVGRFEGGGQSSKEYSRGSGCLLKGMVLKRYAMLENGSFWMSYNELCHLYMSKLVYQTSQ